MCAPLFGSLLSLSPRKRRVKCDETKSNCVRCIRFGFECDGYAADKKEESVSTALVVAKPILPKPNLPRPAPMHSPWRPVLLNEQEYRYFRVFCDQTMSSLSGFFDEPLWGRLVLRACELDPKIFHALVAIGALDKILDTTSQSRYGIGSSQQRNEALGGETHYKFAVQQYAKAIKGMRDSVARGRQDLNSTVIACLLAVLSLKELHVIYIYNCFALIESWFFHFSVVFLFYLCRFLSHIWCIGASLFISSSYSSLDGRCSGEDCVTILLLE
jgi:hypothetical protein